MPADPVLVIDAGTSSLRAVAVTSDGDASLVDEAGWAMFTPPDAEPFGREFHAREVQAALSGIIERASSQRVAAIACTGQREGLVFLNERQEPVLISPNVDARASAEGIEIDARHAAEVYATTGHLPSLMQAPAKLNWLRANRPDDARRVHTVLPLADWLASALTGVAATSRSLAVENGLLDVTTKDVALSLLERLGCDASLIPQLIADGAIAGEATNGAFSGIPVVHAGADTQCALVGMGALAPGETGVPAGWSAPLQFVTDRPVFDSAKRTWTGLHVVPDRWVIESNAGETGRAWQWICDLFGLDPESAQCLAGQSPPGASDVLAVLGSPVMSAAEMTAGVGGVTFPLPLVMSSPTRADVLRSVLEATAYAIRANLEQLEEVNGTTIDTLRLGGGMSQSKLFAQIVADVLDRPVHVASTHHTTAVGAAMLSFVALGSFPSLNAAAEAMTRRSWTAEPHTRLSTQYDDSYNRWRAMSESFARMASEA